MVVPIFYYHSVGGEPPQTLARERFRAHLEAIRRHGYRTVTLAQLLAGEYGAKTCVLTFDDGLLDNFEVVFPLLREFGMVATFFVVPGYDELTRWVHPLTGQWSDEVKAGYTIPFENMKASHRAVLAEAGMEIGCHTFTHRKLTHLEPAEWEREIEGARTHLEEELGREVSTFCYPNGRFNLRILQRVRQAGFGGACSTIPGYFRPSRYRFLLPRFLVEDPVYFEEVLLGRAFSPRNLWRLLWCWLRGKFSAKEQAGG